MGWFTNPNTESIKKVTVALERIVGVLETMGTNIRGLTQSVENLTNNAIILQGRIEKLEQRKAK